MTTEFRILIEDDNMLKMEKDLIELQKTIIYYGEKQIKILEQLEKLLSTTIDKDKKEKKKEEVNPMIGHLNKLNVR